MSAVAISKSPPVVVKPSEPVAATGDIHLSSYDAFYGPTPATALWVFEHPIQEPVETIKRALSQALVHYYPLAGRLAAGSTAGDDVFINCTMEGVSFVGASANCALKDVPDLADPLLKEDLAVFYPAAADGVHWFSDPLLLMQVTVFSCGGFILGGTFRHAVADGVGICQFMQAVGELCRGLPSPSVVPVRQHGSIISSPPAVLVKFASVLGSIQPSRMAVLDITVKPSLVNRIKDKFASTNSGRRPCSVFEAVAAVLWRCRTRAIMSDPEALTVLVVPTDGRKYAGAEKGYYGNCLLAQLATATTGVVANGDLVDLVKLIRGGAGKDGVPGEAVMDELLRLQDWYNLLLMTSWRNIGLEAVQFGAGGAARVMGHSLGGMTALPECTACLPCKDEYSVFSICVKEDHATAFLQEVADAHHIVFSK